MRLDELEWEESTTPYQNKARERAKINGYRIYRNRETHDNYVVYAGKHGNKEYAHLDPITMQAVLYELLKQEKSDAIQTS